MTDADLKWWIEATAMTVEVSTHGSLRDLLLDLRDLREAARKFVEGKQPPPGVVPPGGKCLRVVYVWPEEYAVLRACLPGEK